MRQVSGVSLGIGEPVLHRRSTVLWEPPEAKANEEFASVHWCDVSWYRSGLDGRYGSCREGRERRRRFGENVTEEQMSSRRRAPGVKACEDVHPRRNRVGVGEHVLRAPSAMPERLGRRARAPDRAYRRGVPRGAAMRTDAARGKQVLGQRIALLSGESRLKCVVVLNRFYGEFTDASEIMAFVSFFRAGT